MDTQKIRKEMVEALSQQTGVYIAIKTIYNGCLTLIFDVWFCKDTHEQQRIKAYRKLPSLIMQHLQQKKLKGSVRETEAGALHVEILKSKRDSSCDCR